MDERASRFFHVRSIRDVVAMSRRYNPRWVKGHETYTAPELARAGRVTVPTVRLWKKQGLKPIDERRPHLFLGQTVRDFWRSREAPRVRLEPGEFYCVACKAKRLPNDLLVATEPYSATSINFIGTCPVCGRGMRRGVCTSEIAEKLGPCRIAHEDDSSTMVRSGDAPQLLLFEEMPE